MLPAENEIFSAHNEAAHKTKKHLQKKLPNLKNVFTLRRKKFPKSGKIPAASFQTKFQTS